MATDVVMPRLSDSMEEGTILEWLREPGEEVTIGQGLVEIETDKANMVYEADATGTLLEILVAAGGVAPVGSPIARLGAADEAPVTGFATEQPAPESSAPSGPPPEEAATREPRVGSRPKASPLARRLAGELNVELTGLAGSGPGGRITKSDVEAAAAAGNGRAEAPESDRRGAVETAKGTVETVELDRQQEVVARRMSESKATVPHFYLQAEIEMTAAVELRAGMKRSARAEDPVPSLNDMVVRACALALREFPQANGSYGEDGFELHSRINVGIAVAAPGRLVVPTIFDADRKGLFQIAKEARAVAEKVRDGSVTPPELAGGTFTVSNLGMFGVSSFEAIVNSPQAAILAVGEVSERPLVRAGELVVGRAMSATLSCDHRILYGADGAQFLRRVRDLLEEPTGLVL